MTIPPHLISLGDDDLRLAAEAADAAGAIIRLGKTAGVEIEQKGFADLVSEVDKEADAAIAAIIRSAHPKDAIVSEELEPDTKERAGRLWFVDPLDGTSGFLFGAGDDVPAVLIALREGGEYRLGVVHFPLTGEWFYTAAGKGAYRDGEKLDATKAVGSLREAWVAMNAYGDAQYESAGFATLRRELRSAARGAPLVTTPPPHSGIALRILEPGRRLGAVIHDNAPQKVKQGPWDIAAPQAILEEAGGCFVNFSGGRVDPFTAEPMLACGRRQLADEILSLLQ